VGLNSARSVLFSGAGRLNEGQAARAAAWLQSAPATAIKIVVTHHPFDVPEGHRDDHLAGRSAMAMSRLAKVGADLFLAGHLHVSPVGHTAERYQIAGHCALVVQAGTLSTRHRGEPNLFNLLRAWRVRRSRLSVTPGTRRARRSCRPGAGHFSTQRTDGVWGADARI